MSADGADDTDGAWSYVARLGTNGNLVEDLHFLPVVPLPNGEVHLALRGQKVSPYVLQASSDLIQWTTVATDYRPAVLIGFIDRHAADFPKGSTGAIGAINYRSLGLKPTNQPAYNVINACWA